MSLTNKDRYEYLKVQHEKIQTLLDGLKNSGIEVNTAENGWITLADSFCSNIEAVAPERGKWEYFVPSGYPDTFEHIFDSLQQQINNFNRTYNISVKGIQGEEKTSQSLKAISINYPVLHNVLLEEGSKENRFSAETDTIVITDRAIFLIETKNFGGKGDKIIVSGDGRWELFDRYKKRTISIKNNPYKQVSDHIFVIRKFLGKHNVKADLPIIPIIAIANNDVDLEVADAGLTKIIRTELIGTYILQYLDSHSAVIDKDSMEILRSIFDHEKLPPRKYNLIEYYENIKIALGELVELLGHYKSDIEREQRIKEEAKKQRKKQAEEAKKQKQEEENRQAFWNGVRALGVLVYGLFDSL